MGEYLQNFAGDVALTVGAAHAVHALVVALAVGHAVAPHVLTLQHRAARAAREAPRVPLSAPHANQHHTQSN